MNKTEHLSIGDLILFMDREIDGDAANRAEHHLLNCSDCAQRLHRLKSGSTAYEEYREQVLQPALLVPMEGPARVSPRAGRDQRRFWGFTWAAACACALVLAVVYLSSWGGPNAQEILTRAIAAQEPARGNLLLTAGKQRLFRRAVLKPGDSEAQFRHVRALFIEAHYSWEDPLSARSFAKWRHALPEKQDVVTSIREPGGRKFYRVRSRTVDGILRSASLTLQADTYRATKAGFDFQGEDPIEMSEQSEPSSGEMHEARQSAIPPPSRPKPTETIATPEDELRVFAALDAIDADADEPIDVKLDAEHRSVLVTGMGILEARRKEIETATAALPNTVVRFSARQPLGNDAGMANQWAPDADSGSLATRQKLEDRYGGVRQLQAATDKALDFSNGLFARAHSLRVLAREFPPVIETALNAGSAMRLLSLRQRHIGAMAFALRQLKEELQPLTTGVSAPDRSAAASPDSHWQTSAQDLFTSARNLDSLVNRLLAGSYSDEAGDEMLKQLPIELSRVESLIRSQSVTDDR